MAEQRNPKDKPGTDDSPQGDAGGKGPVPPPAPKLSRGLMSWVMILALLIMLFVLLNGTKGRGREIETWQDFKQYVSSSDIEPDSIVIKDDRITALVKPEALGFEPSKQPRPIWVRIDSSDRSWYRDRERADVWYRRGRNRGVLRGAAGLERDRAG